VVSGSKGGDSQLVVSGSKVGDSQLQGLMVEEKVGGFVFLTGPTADPPQHANVEAFICGANLCNTEISTDLPLHK